MAFRMGRIREPTKGSIGKTRTDELAVMVDTFRPLQLTTHALALENPRAFSWTDRS